MQEDATRGEQLPVHDLADAFVDEVEPVAHVLEHLAPDELLHTSRRLGLAGPGRLPQERERELPPDDGRHDRQLAGARAQPS